MTNNDEPTIRPEADANAGEPLLPDSESQGNLDQHVLRILVRRGFVEEQRLSEAKSDSHGGDYQKVLDELVEQGAIGLSVRDVVDDLASALNKALSSLDQGSDAGIRSASSPVVAKEPTLPPSASTDQADEVTLPPSTSPGEVDEETFPPKQTDETVTVGPGQPAGSMIDHGNRVYGVDPAKRFGDYEIIDEIARGGMGVVYKARQISLNRTVALKKVLSGQLAGDEAIKRFQVEAEASANLDHPGIVPVYDFGQSDGQHFFSMGFVEGQSLAHRISESPLAPRDAAEMLIKISRAVGYANEHGVIHRDLKPGNVLLDRVGEPRVTDFGIAKKSSDDSAVTATGQILGTPSYMPPEQASGQGDQVDHRADVYALGAILYATLTGRPPFQAANPMETIKQVLEQEPVSIKQLIATMPRDLETICLKCLRKEADKRYDNANDLANDLERWLNGEPIVARRVSRAERAWKWCKRKPVIVGSIATIVTLLIVGSVIFWERQNASYAAGRVEALLKANTSQVNGIVVELDDYRYWANEPLTKAFQTSTDGTDAKLHTAMASISQNDDARTYAADQLLLVRPSQFADVRDALADNVTDERIAEYWDLVNDPEEDAKLRFQAACAVASFDADHQQWQDSEFQSFVAEQLVSVLPSELQLWRNALQPVKDQLAEPLGSIYRDPTAGEQARSFATDTLSDYLSDDADGLFDLLADASLKQLPAIFARISEFEAEAIELGNAEIAKVPGAEASPEDLERLAIRQANAAIMLLQLDAHEQAWSVLKHTPNPRARSYLIHWLSPLDGDPQSLIARFKQEPDVTIKRALLLCLGEFDDEQLPTMAREPLIETLLAVYRDDPDAGLHAAAEWLLRRWGQFDELTLIDVELAQTEAQLQAEAVVAKQWYLNGQGQTFVIFDAGEFMMGSPESEAGHESYEVAHLRSIHRRLAISTKEVTKSQFREFEQDKQSVIAADEPSLARYALTEDSPMTAVTWYEAAWYCNWLSEQEGIPEDQWVYEKNDAGEYGPGMRAKENFWELTGYRLPTEAEWEFACRATATTSRYYGDRESLLGEYARYLDNSEDHLWDVAERKPNDFGLFGMLGNAYEWCFDDYEGYPESSNSAVADAPETSPAEDTEGRVLRGGSFNYNARHVRSADRGNAQPSNRYTADGFRVARTYHLSP